MTAQGQVCSPSFFRCHCEERSDVAIQMLLIIVPFLLTGLPRYARNDNALRATALCSQ